MTLVQVAPACRYVGSYRRRVRAGANVVRFRARFGGRALAAGTYSIRIDAPSRDRPLLQVRVVVAAGTLRPAGPHAALHASACARRLPTQAADATSAGGGRDRGGTAGVAATKPPTPRPPASLPTRVGHAAEEAAEAAARAHPLVLATVVLAILLLGAAALPAQALPATAARGVLVERRPALAIAGMTALLLAALAFLATVL